MSGTSPSLNGDKFTVCDPLPHIAHRFDKCAGDLIYVNLSGSDVMVINSFTVAKALFETKATNFSDRPSMYFTCDLVGWGDLPLFMNYGPAVVGHRRRMLQSVGSKRSIETLESTLRSVALKCLKDIAESPAQLQNHVRR
jgi:hypothetical protein